MEHDQIPEHVEDVLDRTDLSARRSITSQQRVVEVAGAPNMLARSKDLASVVEAKRETLILPRQPAVIAPLRFIGIRDGC